MPMPTGKLARKLSHIWAKAQTVGGPPVDLTGHRYVPRSLTGGTGWGVFDNRLDRFLTDAEVLGIKSERLANERIVH